MYREYVFCTWYAIATPPNTPRDTVNRHNLELTKVLNDTVVADRLAPTGVYVSPTGVDEFNIFVRRDIDNYRKMIEIAGVKFDTTR